MIFGNAVPTTVWSSATRKSASMRPATASTVPRRPAPSPPDTLALISALPRMIVCHEPRLFLHRLGEQPKHPPEFLELLFVQDAMYPAPELVVYFR